MKPASCFGDLASFSNRQKRLQQNRRYSVDIHNDDFGTRLLVVLLAKPTNVVLCSRLQCRSTAPLHSRSVRGDELKCRSSTPTFGSITKLQHIPFSSGFA